MLLLGWLATRLGWELPRELEPEDGGLLCSRARRGGREIELRLEPAPQDVPGLAGRDGRGAAATRCRSTAGRAGWRAKRTRADGARVVLGRAGRVARRGRASSARGSARRCCATRPTRRRSRRRRRCWPGHAASEWTSEVLGRRRRRGGRALVARRRARRPHRADRRLDAAAWRTSARPRMGADWSRSVLWFGDDRCVPPDDERSNYRLAKEALLDRDRRGAASHRIEGELGHEEAAARYESALRSRSAATSRALDLILLGLGPRRPLRRRSSPASPRSTCATARWSACPRPGSSRSSRA